MNKLKDLTLEELKNLKAEKEAYASIWKGCNDGSYEAALGNSGYYPVVNEIRHREEN